jgi:hypothetical protein
VHVPVSRTSEPAPTARPVTTTATTRSLVGCRVATQGSPLALDPGRQRSTEETA